jgi:hypothetical protein
VKCRVGGAQQCAPPTRRNAGTVLDVLRGGPAVLFAAIFMA